MSHNYYGHNQGNAGYPSSNPYAPPSYYPNPPRYGVPPNYPPAGQPPYGYPPPPNAHYSPQVYPPYSSQGGSWQNRGPRHKSGQRFNKKGRNNNSGNMNKFNKYAQNLDEICDAPEDSTMHPNTNTEGNNSEQDTSGSEDFPPEMSNKSKGCKMENTSPDQAVHFGNEGYLGPHPYPSQPFYAPSCYGAPPGYPPPGALPPPSPYRYPPSGHFPPPPSQGYPPYAPFDGNWSNGGRPNFRPPFNGPQQSWNQNNHKRKFNDNNGMFNSGKKQKIDKRELPENNKFSCDTCNRGFKTEELFKTHVDSHVKCQIEGCNFVAHEKLVQMHFEHVHLSGLASKLESAKNIEEWKAERKRNYPTKENIERKEKERQEAIARGELPERPGKGGKSKKSWQEKRREKYLNKKLHRQQQAETEIKTDSADVSDTTATQAPTSASTEMTSIQASTSASTDVIIPEITIPTPKDEISDDRPIDQTKEEDIKSEPSHEDQQVKGLKTTADDLKPTVDLNKSKKRQHHQNGNQRRKLSFAEKFMERDIKQEMNVMLQVAAFFVKKLHEGGEEARTDTSEEQS